jgi:hypothetical protein
MISVCGYAQKAGTTINNTFNKVKRVNMNGGTAKILHADSVFIKVEASLKSTLFLNSCFQYKDSVGNYITKLSFNNPDARTYSDVEISLSYDKEVHSTSWDLGGSTIQAFAEVSGPFRSRISVGIITKTDGITATVYSKEKLKIAIAGVVIP